MKAYSTCSKGNQMLTIKLLKIKLILSNKNKSNCMNSFFIVNRRDNYLKDIKEINKKIIKIAGFSIEGLR